MNEGMITLGCIMAKVFEHESGEITSASEDAKLTFCHTTNSETDLLIVTPRMRELGAMGFSPIAIAKVQRDEASQFCLVAASGLSESLRSALAHEGRDLIHKALSSSLGGENIPPISD